MKDQVMEAQKKSAEAAAATQRKRSNSEELPDSAQKPTSKALDHYVESAF
jgi:hypothetical protein